MLSTFVTVFSVTSSATDVTPTFFWNLLDKKTGGGNYDNFKKDGIFVTSTAGNIVLEAKEGDDNTKNLFVWFDGGMKYSDIQVVVAKFKHNRTDVQVYPSAMGIIGKEGGEEKYAKPEYAKTEDWQTLYFDFSNSFAGDANYLNWVWHEAAAFGCTIEIEYIAAFKSTADADSFVANYGKVEEPDVPEGTVPTPGLFWNFDDKSPAGSNIESYAERKFTDDGNVYLPVIDGNGDTSHLQAFMADGVKMGDVKYVVVKLKHDRTEVQGYHARAGLIGKDAKEEKYSNAEYSATDNWQYLYFDFSGNYTTDAWYINIIWHEAAMFGCNVEIEYIAGFGTMKEAKAFAERYTKSAEENEDDNPDTFDPFILTVVALVPAFVAFAVCNGKKKH